MEYGLIAEKLGHSYSKEIHEMLGRYKYEFCELSKDEIPGFFEKREFKGINVTIPYKETVIPFLDEIDEAAESIGAVNTIVNRDGKLKGYNTDYYGLRSLIEKEGFSFAGKKVLILGTGGTSKTAHTVATDLGALQVLKVSRGKESAITYEDAIKLHSDAEFIINTTPVGMFPNCEGCPIDVTAFKSLMGVVDCIFNPLNSNLVLQARAHGVKATGGLYMLVMQAMRAAELFTEETVDDRKALEIYRAIKTQKGNISLIGMPAVGKSTIGKLLSRALGMEYVDTDELIVNKEKREIKDIFATDGEAYFRALEKEIIKEVSSGKGTVISTGGGCIKDPDNMANLKRSGMVLFLDRPGDSLSPSDSRPLSDTKEKMEALYKERLPIYQMYADACVNLSGKPGDNIDKIRRIIDED